MAPAPSRRASRRRRLSLLAVRAVAPIAALVFFVASLLLPPASAATHAGREFRPGDFLPSARRLQYHGVRTPWADLLGRHCPRFLDDGLLAIPLPAPADGAATLTGTYKVQLAFDGDRLSTPWLTVLGRAVVQKDGGPAVPIIRLVFQSRGGRLARVSASVGSAPPDYLAAHGGLAAEWADPSAWPKHVPVAVSWAPPAPSVNRRAGAGAVLATCLAAAGAGLVAALAGKERLVAELMDDLAGAVGASGGPAGPWDAAAGGSGSGGTPLASGAGNPAFRPPQPQQPYAGPPPALYRPAPPQTYAAAPAQPQPAWQQQLQPPPPPAHHHHPLYSSAPPPPPPGPPPPGAWGAPSSKAD